MEDLNNKKGIEKFAIPIFTEFPLCSMTGVFSVQEEDKYFRLERKVKQLDKIIDVILLRLDKIKDSNKENIIKTIHEKINELNEILVKFPEIKKQHSENDKYYQELFEFYARKYEDVDVFVFDEKKNI